MADGSTRRALTIAELNRLSGLSISTLRRRVADGSLPVIQPGGPRTRMTFLPNVLEALSQPRRPIARAVPTENPKPVLSEGKISKPIPGPPPRWQQRHRYS